MYVRYLYFYGVGVWPENNPYNTNGGPVRCVASQVSNRKALKPTTASTTFFTGSPSRYRMEGSSSALPAIGAVAGRSAASGQGVPVQVSTLTAWPSTVSASGRRTATIRLTASQFVASPVKLAKTLPSFPVRCVASQVKHNKKTKPKEDKALKPTTASTTSFTSSPSRYRMEGTPIALPAVGANVGRPASSGQRVPIQLPTLATCTSAVSASGRRATASRRAASQFVAKPKSNTKKSYENQIQH